MLSGGLEVCIVKTVIEVLTEMLPEAKGSIFKPEVTVFYYTDLNPKPPNNIPIFPAINWLTSGLFPQLCL